MGTILTDLSWVRVESEGEGVRSVTHHTQLRRALHRLAGVDCIMEPSAIFDKG